MTRLKQNEIECSPDDEAGSVILSMLADADLFDELVAGRMTVAFAGELVAKRRREAREDGDQ